MRSLLLATQYRLLAAAFAEEGAAAETLGCLAAALELQPGPQDQAARTTIDKLFEVRGGLAPGKQTTARLARLKQRRRRLDSLWASERQVGESLETPSESAQPQGDEAALPDGLIRRMVQLEARLQRQSDPRFRAVSAALESLLDRSHPASSPAAGLEADDDGLSLEHELHNLANDFYREGCFDEAIRCYDLVLMLRDDLLETWFNRALAHTRKRSYDEAEADMSRVIELNPNLAEAWYTRGLIRQYKEEYGTAVADFDKALEVDPAYGKARDQRDVAVRKLDETRPRHRGRGDESNEDSEGRVRDFSPYVSKPDYTLADVGGHRQVKRRLRTIAAYLQGSPVLVEWGAELPRGVLLCGRPGVGKTHLARCLAGEAQCPFYAPPTSVFEDMWAGNMQKNLRRLWEQAGQHPRAIIFLDEFDSLGVRRAGARDPDAWYNRMVGCILELMDNLARRTERVVVIAATNRKKNIDPAFLRPGRFSYVIEVGAPNAVELAEIWLIHLEAAAARAHRIDFFGPELDRAVLAGRREWLDAVVTCGDGDLSGIMRLARLSAEKSLVGDDVREVVRRTIDERVMAAMDCSLDLGPITADDLYRQLEDYEPQCTDEAEAEEDAE